MKKTFALLLACLMLVAILPGTAIAYEAVKPGTAANNFLTTDIQHSLKLNIAGATTLPYDITYTFTTELIKPTSAEMPNLSEAVSNNPSIAPIVYRAKASNGEQPDVFDATSKVCTKQLQIDWSNVVIKEPGIYVWKVTQSANCDDNDPINDPSNNNQTKYLHVYVTTDGTNLSVAGVFMTEGDGTPGATGKNDAIQEEYPSQLYNLKVAKTVSGSQGSKERYFKFTVTLTAPAGAAERIHPITDVTSTTPSFDVNVPTTAYHAGINGQPTSVTLTAGTAKSVVIWLKHGQSFTIENLLYGTAYTIIEDETDYTVTTTVDGVDKDTTTRNNREVTNSSMTGSAIVTYTNEKEVTTPTGISLHTAAPVMGILLAMSLLAILFVGKRKEYVA